MLIHFVHPGQSYLPELAAYTGFLRGRGHDARVHTDPAAVPDDARVVWWMCGRVPAGAAQRLHGAFQVHEYASASVPPWAWLKDRAKAWRQPVPQYRIFQNAWVAQRLGFGDAVPAEYRDMGVPEAFLARPGPARTGEFDFAYLGDMQRLHAFLPLLRALGPAGRRLLLVGAVPAGLQAVFARLPAITLAGRVAQGEVPAQLARARWGLNLVPVRTPYDRQTSTKLLEYCAAGLPVVSTDYAWVRGFERDSGARFAYVPARAAEARYAALLGPALDTQDCVVPAMQAHAWPAVLARLRIWQHLEAHA